MEVIKWSDKYRITLQEEVSIREIMKLCSVGQPRAMAIRNEAIEYCIKNNIKVGCKRVPTNVVLDVLNKDIDYYYKKMMQEHEVDMITSRGPEYVSA